MPFTFEKLEIEGLVLVKPKVFGDNRGFFMESYKKSDFVKNGIDVDFVQDNHSKSTAHVLRGLHYQALPKPQAKLVRCSKGRIYDFAVDLRKESKTFGKWQKVELSEENKNMFFIKGSKAGQFTPYPSVSFNKMTSMYGLKTLHINNYKKALENK